MTTRIFDKIIKNLIYAIVFLLPLFWLPFSFEAFEFNKQFLLFFLVSLALIFYLARMIFVDKEIRFRRGPLDIPVLLFLLTAVLSVVFSVDRISSLFGFYGRFSNGLVGLFSVAALYFLIVNNTKFSVYPSSSSGKEAGQISGLEEKGILTIDGLLKAFYSSVFFVVLTSYFSIFGVWQKLGLSRLFHLEILSQRAFNPVSGSLQGLAVFLAIVLVFLCGLILVRKKGRPLVTLFYYLFLISISGLLIIINFPPAWMVVLTSLFVFIAFSLVSRIFREDVNRLLLVILLLVVSSFFLLFSHSSFFKTPFPNLPQEQLLSQKISWETSWNALKSGAKSFLLGSGPGTFRYDFSKFKPLDFSKSPFWTVRFDRPASYLSEVLATRGIAGSLSYLILVGTFLFICCSPLFRKKKEGEGLEERMIPLAFLSVFLALIFAHTFYYQNTVLLFIFWFVLGAGAGVLAYSSKEKTISFKSFPELGLVFSTIFLIFSLTVLVSYYLGARIYLADRCYRRSLLTSDIGKKTELLERAVRLNPYFSTYKIVLAKTYDFEIRQKGGSEVANWAKRAVDLAKGATEESSNDVAAWETLGMIYRDIRPISSGRAVDFAVKAFKKAIDLEPGNPVLFTELGKLYLSSDIKKAREHFAKAEELNSSYLDASLQKALTYEAEKNPEEAIKQLEKIVKNNPPNYQNYLLLAEIRFQLGRLYFNANRLDEAVFQLNRALDLAPNHSNSLYVLGLVYKKKGEKDKAISYFKRVLELNPGNKEVEKQINSLKEEKTNEKSGNEKSEK